MKLHEVDSVEIGGKSYFTRHWYMWGAGHAMEDGMKAHRMYYGQFVTEGVKRVVRSQFSNQLWAQMREALAKGDDCFNSVTRLQAWDMLSPWIHPLVARLVTDCEYAEFAAGKVAWSLSSNVCICKEAARQIMESENHET